MASLITTNGKSIMLYRTYTANGSLSSTLYLTPSKFKMGISSGTVAVEDTDLDIAIPLSNGTVNDNGDNTLTGSDGGDNSTDNTTTYKEGAGLTDATSQNLIANGTDVNKIWTIANLAALGTNIIGTQPFGLWFYIKDATTLAKFVTTGNALLLKFGSDAANHYTKPYTAADLSVGWNWLTSGTTNVEDLTESGTVTGNIDTFLIAIDTNNAADTFVAGDVIYDLLRQWQLSDLIKSFQSGYPTFDYVNNEVEIRCYLNSLEANGFTVDSLGIFNEDTSPLMAGADDFTDESKSSTDEFIFIIKDRII